MAALSASGCVGPQSMMEPAGPGAAAIATLWWVLLAICTAVFLVVMAGLLLAIFRRRPGGPESDGEAAAAAGSEGDAGDAEGERRRERSRTLAVLTAGAFVPAFILLGIWVYTMVVLDRMGPSAERGNAADMTVLITGKQYWWDVRYFFPATGDTVVTANEVHIPVGREVTILLESADVIHSVWLPRLHGKTDMIPGRTTRMWLKADEPGVYHGQCAEYCGAQHTWMRLLVVAEPLDDFRAWVARQRRPAAPPPPAPDPVSEAMDHQGPPVPDSVREAGLARNARIRRGHEVFRDAGCHECHDIRGEFEESDHSGPDLTHVASRRTLAAGRLANNRGNMGGWIANPQVLKPGNLMPRRPLEPEELGALIDYLMTLR